jgi:hypothetical protein
LFVIYRAIWSSEAQWLLAISQVTAAMQPRQMMAARPELDSIRIVVIGFFCYNSRKYSESPRLSQ